MRPIEPEDIRFHDIIAVFDTNDNRLFAIALVRSGNSVSAFMGHERSLALIKFHAIDVKRYHHPYIHIPPHDFSKYRFFYLEHDPTPRHEVAGIPAPCIYRILRKFVKQEYKKYVKR